MVNRHCKECRSFEPIPDGANQSYLACANLAGNICVIQSTIHKKTGLILEPDETVYAATSCFGARLGGEGLRP